MPFTPFHFGLGLLGKGLAPARVSVASFVATQVVIDVESAYYLFVAPSAHVHRWAHTLVVAVPLGALVGLALWKTAALFRVSHPASEWSLRRGRRGRPARRRHPPGAVVAAGIGAALLLFRSRS